ncbi:MAG: LysR family transcriptional regulator [Paludibacterium sp.]|uniref:LysR family transcriptional regulator n=1 Tax=Paludibacterium sp. TaxID=1917523 RepID=UPI0025E8C872|nr:LysR family transcriptional regulator [Paludibacterium sp.]MBV8045667.1 LysR family transcriptional regulator [Paludibacterium sp.]MBV8647947.1 LysR family transcriptional regulator [Paludibacterium sp.]
MSLRVSLRELEVFVAVCEELTVTRAALRLAMTQSAASQSLASLESALDTVLFDRVGRRLTANEHGRLLLPKARAILDLGYEAQTLFSGSAAHLRLGASTTIANYLLPLQIARFRASQPQVRLELTVGNTDEIVAAVAAFRVDIGFIEGPCHHPELKVQAWRDDELVVVVGAQHPFAGSAPSFKALAQAEWILRETGSGTRQEVERLLLPRLGAFAVSMEMGDSEAIKHAVAAGLGVSCLPRRVVAGELARGELIELAQPSMTRTLYLVMHRDKALTRGMARFLDQLGPP